MKSLLDSNIIIDSVQPGRAVWREQVRRHGTWVSVVSKVEALGFHRLDAGERMDLEEFFAVAPLLPIDLAIVDRAVTLRQHRRMSLGDSLIAATALVHGLRLVTRNTADFRRVDGLELLNPSVDPWPVEAED